MQFNFFKQKHHIERIKKNAQHDVFGFLIPYKFVIPLAFLYGIFVFICMVGAYQGAHTHFG